METQWEQGHTIDKCYKLHGFPPGFKFIKPKPSYIAENQDRGELTQQQEKTRSYLCSTVTPAQCAQLLNLLKNHNRIEEEGKVKMWRSDMKIKKSQ